MSVEIDPGWEPARARALTARAERRLAFVAADLRADEADRLDDETRATFLALLRSLIGTIRGEIAQRAALTVRATGDAALADALLQADDDDRIAIHLLDDTALLRELDARVRQDLVMAALVPHERADPDVPSLLPRLASDRDPRVAGAAMAMLLALSRRAAPLDESPLARTDLSAEAHHRLVWAVAAALRQTGAGREERTVAALDRALVAAAERSLAAHDEGIALEASAVRLAAALASDGRGGAAAAMEALGDRLLALFIALVAEEVGLGYEAARDAVLDPDPSRLMRMLRAMGMGREEIGDVGLSLATADRRRSLDDLAAPLNAVAGLDPAVAATGFAYDRLPAAYREAAAALAKDAR